MAAKTSEAPPAVRNRVRLAFFLAGLLLAALAIVARLTQVQLVQGRVFAAAARANQVRRIPVAAPRGLILDRHGVVIARSRPSFVCALIPAEIKDVDRTLDQLSRIPGSTAAFCTGERSTTAEPTTRTSTSSLQPSRSDR